MLPHTLHAFSLALTLSTAPHATTFDRLHADECLSRHEIIAHYEDMGLDHIKVQRYSEDTFKVTGVAKVHYVFLIDACTLHEKQLLPRRVAIN